MISRNRCRPRRGATVVEAALVISLCLLFMFAVFEYGRYIFYLQVVENAAREGARMAIAHTNDKVTSDIVDRVRQKLSGVETQMSNVQINVSALILRPKDASETAGTPLPDWTDASSTDGISVEVTGDYRPILPSFLQMPATIPVRVRSVMYSEGN